MRKTACCTAFGSIVAVLLAATLALAGCADKAEPPTTDGQRDTTTEEVTQKKDEASQAHDIADATTTQAEEEISYHNLIEFVESEAGKALCEGIEGGENALAQVTNIGESTLEVTTTINDFVADDTDIDIDQYFDEETKRALQDVTKAIEDTSGLRDIAVEYHYQDMYGTELFAVRVTSSGFMRVSSDDVSPIL